MNELKNFKHKTNMKVRFSDLDAMQHVNNATYLTFLEEARIKYFNDLFNKEESNLDYKAVVGRIEIDYLHPIMLGDNIEIFTKISKVGNKSLDVQNIIVIKRDDENIKAAVALTKLVYFDYISQVTKQIPPEEKERILEFENLSSQMKGYFIKPLMHFQFFLTFEFFLMSKVHKLFLYNLQFHKFRMYYLLCGLVFFDPARI